jgi:hypothetical protein
MASRPRTSLARCGDHALWARAKRLRSTHRAAVAENTKLIDRIDEDFEGSLKDHLSSINKDLATVRERLAHFEAQLGKQN